MFQAKRLILAGVAVLCALAAASVAAASNQPKTGIRMVRAEWVPDFPWNGGWAAVPTGGVPDGHWIRESDVALPQGVYDIYWNPGNSHRSVLLASKVKVAAGAVTDVHADSGVRRVTAPEFEKFAVYGCWAATPVGEPFEKAVQKTATEAMLLPPGEYDIYWYPGDGHKSLRLASAVKVAAGAVTDVHADSGVRRVTAPEFEKFAVYGCWAATLVGEPFENAVQKTATAAMLLAPGEYDIHWYPGNGHNPLRLASNVRVAAGAVTDVHADSGVRRITAPEFEKFAAYGGWAATLVGAPFEKAVQKTATAAMLLPPGEYDIHWYPGDGHNPLRLASNVKVAAGAVTDVHADSGVRRITAPEFEKFGPYGCWAATLVGEPYEKAVQKTWTPAMLLPPGEYDIHWYPGNGYKTLRLASNVTVAPGSITDVHANSGLRLSFRGEKPDVDGFAWWGVVAPGGDAAKPLLSVPGDLTAALLTAPGTYDVVWRPDGSGPQLLRRDVKVEAGRITAVVLGGEPGAARPVEAWYSATVAAGVKSAAAGIPVMFTGRATRMDGTGPAPDADIDIRLTHKGIVRTFRAHSDGRGQFSYEFRPTVGEAGTYSVAADFPMLPDAEPEDTFTLHGLSATVVPTSAIAGETTPTGRIRLTNLGDTPLSGLRSATTELTPGMELRLKGPDHLDANASVEIEYSLVGTGDAPRKASPKITFITSEGATASCLLPTRLPGVAASLSVKEAPLTTAMLRGEQRFVQFGITNEGGAPSGPVKVRVLDAPWLRLATTGEILPIGAGQTVPVVLTLAPGADLPLGVYEGQIIVADGSSQLAVPFAFDAVSTAKGKLQVSVADEFSYYAEGRPRVAGAMVVVKDDTTGNTVASGVSDENGSVAFDDVVEAYYRVEVTAPDHGRFDTTVLVAGSAQCRVEAFLPRELVRYEWSVNPTAIQDEYNITIDAVFATDVPAPVVTIDPPFIDLTQMTAPTMQVEFTVTNHGLITAMDARLRWGQHDRYRITPLVEAIGDLPAHSSFAIPVLIEDLQFGRAQAPLGLSDIPAGAGAPPGRIGVGPAPNGLVAGAMAASAIATELPGPCAGVRFELEYGLSCGKPMTFVRPVYFAVPRSACPGQPAGRGVIIATAGEGGGGDPWPLVLSPIHYMPLPCDSCQVKCGFALMDCAFDFHFMDEASCFWDQLRNCKDVIDPANTELTAKELLPCAWATFKCVKSMAHGEIPGLKQLECVINIIDNCSCILDQIRGVGDSPSPGPPYGDHRPEGPDPDTLFARLPTESSNPRVRYLAQTVNRQLAVLEYHAYIFGDRRWLLAGAAPDSGRLAAWLGALELHTDPASVAGSAVAPAERMMLMALPLPNGIAASDAEAFLDRWNRTAEYYGKGVLEAAQVPGGESTDFIDRRVAWAKLEAACAAIDEDSAEHYDGFMESARAAYAVLKTATLEKGTGYCARVRIQIDQRAVLTRSAFAATISLENNNTADALTGLEISLSIEDEHGQRADDRFGVLAPTVTGALGALDGTQNLGPSSEFTTQWSIVPKDSAAGEGRATYSVRGQIQYSVAGSAVAIPLYPVQITVCPNPALKVNYFLERQVYADDPFTEEVEPSVPFALGLLVSNVGVGPAADLRIASAQPKIVENEKGLLIDVSILGTRVGAEEVSPSLEVSFGDIPPRSTKAACWLLSSSLQGRFESYKATYEQQGPLGQLGVSAIDSIAIHEISHVVHVDAPTPGDGTPDFLANDVPDTEDIPDRIYTGENTILPVASASVAAQPGPLTASLETTARAMLEPGWNYIRMNNPATRAKRIESVTRADGRVVRVNDNAWTTERTRRIDGRAPDPLRWIHILDYAEHPGEQTYIIRFASTPAVGTPQPLEETGRSAGAITEPAKPDNAMRRSVPAAIPSGMGSIALWLGLGVAILVVIAIVVARVRRG